MTDIVTRLREWSAADMDTHASLRRNGAQVAEVPWSRHGTDLAETVLDAAAEIERLRAALTAIAADAAGERYPDTPRTPDEATTGAEKELVYIIDRMSATALASLPDAPA